MSAGPQGRFPDEDLPEGAVIDGAELRGVKHLDCDFVVVGTGAAGAVAGHELSCAGFRVLFLEEGSWVKTREFNADVEGTFARLMRNGGMQAMRGRSMIPLLQGSAVGGSTVINSAIAWRLPEDVLSVWREEFGLKGVAEARLLEPHFEALERALSVRPVADDVLGGNSRLFLEGTQKLGLESSKIHRYDGGCRGSSRCMQGCPSAGKQGMNVTFIPAALRKGAQRVHDAAVRRVEIEGGGASGVRARTRGGGEVVVRARLGVLVAASTIQSPVLLRRSGLRNPAIGENFQCHPGHGVAGLFDRPVDMSFGAAQGAESLSLRKSHGVKLESLTMPPELAAARVPGVGTAFTERMRQLPNVAVWAAQVRASAKGQVRESWLSSERVHFTPNENDLERLRHGVVTLARAFFALGAREVWPGLYGVPSVLRSAGEIDTLRNAPLDPRAWGLVSSHLFGAARMGPDPRASAVNLDFESHEVERLFVIDSSVFPTNLGVNPQHGIMAMARLAAQRIGERFGKQGASARAAA